MTRTKGAKNINKYADLGRKLASRLENDGIKVEHLNDDDIEEVINIETAIEDAKPKQEPIGEVDKLKELVKEEPIKDIEQSNDVISNENNEDLTPPKLVRQTNKIDERPDNIQEIYKKLSMFEEFMRKNEEDKLYRKGVEEGFELARKEFKQREEQNKIKTKRDRVNRLLENLQ